MKPSKRIFAFILSLFVLLSAVIPVTECAYAKKQKTVRIGWYQSNMFQEGTADDEEKSGYAYDYIQRVADYTAWRYEYVYGDWADLLHKLETGEIDMMAGVSITEERKKTMIFPDTEMGTEQYYLYKKSSNKSVSASDFSTLRGKKVGGYKDNLMTTLTQKWSNENNIGLKVVYFKDFKEQEKALKNGEIDLLVQTLTNDMNVQGTSVVAKIGEEPYYLAINKSRKDLLNELNSSLNTMLSVDPYILQNMEYTNYGTDIINRNLSEEEKAWLSKNDTVLVGYLDNYIPFCSQNKKGETEGLMTDVMDGMLEAMNIDNRLKVEYKAFNSYNDMVDALKRDKVDIAFPVYGNLWDLENDGIDATSEVVLSSETLFYKGVYNKDGIKRIAVNENNNMQVSYCKRNFPDAELQFYYSIDDCLNAVAEGKADGTIVNTLRKELVTGNSKYDSLSNIQLDINDSRCFGVNEKNPELLLMLNRGLRILGSSYGIDNSYKYMSSFYSYSVLDFLKNNALLIGFVIALLAAIIIAFLVLNLKKKESSIQKIRALNSELEVLNRKADAANNAKTLFLNNMSHDMRTPMNAILGFAKLMGVNKDNPEAIENYLSKLESSGDYLLSLIDDILDMARIESGNVELDVSCMNLEIGNNHIAEMFAEDMKRKNLKFSYSMQMEHRYVMGDAARTTQIIVNLVSNAVKYTPEGGSICLETKEIPCDREGFASYEFTVSDTGIGMSKDFQEHIFETFSREYTSTENCVTGTGLGMSIVKKIVDMMDGSIEVESSPGKGSTFRIVLSFKIAEEPGKEKTMQSEHTAESFDFAGKRILLAEDNELNAEIASEILKDAGFEVERAADGVQCVDMLMRASEGYYDVILMDIQMPNLNGYMATKKIRAMDNPSVSGIPIFAMTANAFAEDRKKAIEAGMDGHIPKPVDISVLLDVLAKTLKK